MEAHACAALHEGGKKLVWCERRRTCRNKLQLEISVESYATYRHTQTHRPRISYIDIKQIPTSPKIIYVLYKSLNQGRLVAY